MDRKISVDRFVWAKLIGYPPWPSIVLEPEFEVPEKPLNDPGKEYCWVYFFGSHDYSWIEERHIKPYEQYKDKYIPLYKQSLFVGAVQELEEQLEKVKNDPNYVVERKKKFKVQQRGVKRDGRNLARNKKRPKFKTVDINNESLYKSEENIMRSPSDKIFGVIGTGIIGSALTRHLVNSGHTVNIWNRSTKKSDELLSELGHFKKLKSHLSPRAILKNSDIVFICVSNHLDAKRIVENNFGINSPSDNIAKDKGVVVMTNIDPESSRNIGEMVENKGGSYLEAQLQRSTLESVEKSFFVIAAGCRDLFDACHPCFYALGGANSSFFGDVGNAARINIIIQIMKGICLGALTEGLALAERCGLPQDKFLDIFNLTGLSSTYLKGKGNIIVSKDFCCNGDQSLKHMQKDLKMGLELSNKVQHPMLLTSIANQIFKHCCKLDYGSHDAAAIYLRNKH
ncbi:cytokine-like nuclear factor N-PAC [Leptinotarsa decemlineata]|uniref:cytokine-like nuclear factor N-PAC n=1 Tax=Leptinotarsa decemlineata TaxID=7539 RepID=UPI000C253F99|nr:putative oxidoreductase GLYR1 homolog [Leptinotarsa decemlineata]